MNKSLIVREHDEITGIDADALADLKAFALENQYDAAGNHRPVLEWRNGKLKAGKYVGLLQTRAGVALEILPKVDLVAGDDAATKRVFLQMLRAWRGVNAAQLSDGDIRAMRRFNMLEIFARLFLENLRHLTRRGLAMHYQAVEENLPRLKGRILFAPHLNANIANRAKFYVQYDDFNANRPANRLIHSAIDKLSPMLREAANRTLLRQMQICFSEVPVSHNYDDDWRKHKIDRGMRHYRAVMQWVGVFLFGRGLATFAGAHVNRCLLFPMAQLFEDFVAKSFRAHQNHLTVHAQSTGKYLATTDDGRNAFQLRPDMRLSEHGRTRFILDTKWKRIRAAGDDPKRGISQADMYQLFAYGKKYRCRTVALVYPKTAQFAQPVEYAFDSDLRLVCLPFDVTDPRRSVRDIVDCLRAE